MSENYREYKVNVNVCITPANPICNAHIIQPVSDVIVLVAG